MNTYENIQNTFEKQVFFMCGKKFMQVLYKAATTGKNRNSRTESKNNPRQ